MNWAQFKYPVFHMCLAVAVVASWSLTQEVGLSPFNVMTNIFVTEFGEFSENISGKLKYLFKVDSVTSQASRIKKNYIFILNPINGRILL